jgi:hypothetical protein
MSIAATQPVKPSSARRPHGGQRSVGHTADSDPIAVLIRLPDLRPVSCVGAPRVEPAQEPTPAAAPPVGIPATAEAKASGPDVDQKRVEPVSERRLLPAFDPGRFAGQLRLPKRAWQAAAAAAVLLLILAALTLIRGGDPGSPVAAVADPEHPVRSGLSELPPPKFFETAGVPEIHIPPILPDGPPDRPATDVPSSPAAAPPVQPKPSEAAESDPQPAPSAPTEKDTATGQPAAVKKVAEQETPAEPVPGKPALAEAADRKPGGDAAAAIPEKPPQAPLAENARNSQRPADQQTPARHASYPATNPASYQYPSNYQELFVASSSDPAGSARVPYQDPRSIYDPQPNTARLQPHIEAPPLR